VTAAGLAIAIPAIGASITARGSVAGPVPGYKAAETQAFYPKVITIHAGDRVRFTVNGFHTVTFVPNGAATPGIIGPTGGNAAAANDPAGAPYWWGGKVPQFAFNLPALGRSKRLVVTGRSVVSSGLPTGRTFTPTFTFPKPGVYKYHCIPHPGMTGTVRVLPRAKRVPTATAQARQGAAQLKADQAALVARIRRLTKNPAANTVLVGIGTRRGSWLGFAPKRLSVRAGTAVTFRWDGTNEIHTVTFGPRADRDRLAAGFANVTQPLPAEAQYPSDPPGAPVVVTPTAHGNGLVNSGVIFDPTAPDRVPGSPSTWTVTFPTAGTYDYICIVHPDMQVTVTDTP
jgi:plastocyanin